MITFSSFFRFVFLVFRSLFLDISLFRYEDFLQVCIQKSHIFQGNRRNEQSGTFSLEDRSRTLVVVVDSTCSRKSLDSGFSVDLGGNKSARIDEKNGFLIIDLGCTPEQVLYALRMLGQRACAVRSVIDSRDTSLQNLSDSARSAMRGIRLVTFDDHVSIEHAQTAFRKLCSAWNANPRLRQSLIGLNVHIGEWNLSDSRPSVFVNPITGVVHVHASQATFH